MPRSETEQKAWELQCYGMTQSDIEQHIVPQFFGQNRNFIAFSLLSDVQEMIERDMKEKARQTINIAKFLMRDSIRD